MALAVVAVFVDLQEAQIAAGALRAAGLAAEVFDGQLGAVYWIAQSALGGYRVVVPQAEAADALALLQQIRDTAPPAGEPVRTSSYPRTVGAAAMLPFNASLGWLFVRRRPFGRDAWTGTALVTAGLIAASLALYMAWRLLDHPSVY
jgi:hypothetical protein